MKQNFYFLNLEYDIPVWMYHLNQSVISACINDKKLKLEYGIPVWMYHLNQSVISFCINEKKIVVLWILWKLRKQKLSLKEQIF